MEDPKDHIIDEEIMKYLDGELSSSELEKFNEKLKNDSTFAKRVEEYQELINSIKINEKSKIRQQILEASDHNSNKAVTNSKIEQKTITMTKENKSRRSLIPLLAAATVAVLVAGYFWTNNAGVDTNKLFTDNYNQQVAAVDTDLKSIAGQNKISRSGTTEDTMTVVWNGERILKMEFDKLEKSRRDQLISGLNNFKKSKWTESVTVLSKYVEAYNSPVEDQNKALFYLAKARLNAGQYAKAADTYHKYLDQSKDKKDIVDQAEWDRAMCYIMLDQSKVKSYLTEMAGDNGHTYQDDAKGLIDYFE